VLITEIPDFTLDNQIANMDRHERAPGCHVSNVIGSIDRRYGKLKGRTDIDEKPDTYWNNYRVAGFLIERAFRELLQDLHLTRPGALVLDGIHMTPDFIDADEWVLEEYKATWRSSAHEIDGPVFDSWMMQMKAYCKALGCLRARLRVFFMNGNYRPRVPEMKAWNIEWTQRELDQNWEMILSHARSEGMI
jgi:hypothetical protein